MVVYGVDDAGLPNMEPRELLRAAQEVFDRMPDAQLAKNRVGNLAILDAAGDFQVGYIDLRYGEVEWYAANGTDDED